MQVQRVAMPTSSTSSWTVLGDDDVPVEPVEWFLGYLSDIERSPNTVRAYAHDLKDYSMYLSRRGLDWREVRLENIGEFVACDHSADGDTVHQDSFVRRELDPRAAHAVRAG